MIWLRKLSACMTWISLGLPFMTMGEKALSRSLTIYTPDWPPFYIQDSQNPNHKGMAWDILETCADRIDRKAVFDNYPIRRMIKQMEDGDLDVNIMSFKEDRQKMLAYGKEVIFENNYVIIVGNHVTKPIRSLSDLDNLSIAQLVGLRPSDAFKSWFDQRLKKTGSKETLMLNTEEQILKMLAYGRIDATVASLAEFRWRSHRLGLASRIRSTNLLIKKQPYFLVMAKQSPIYKAKPQTLTNLDRCVRDLKKSGVWGNLKRQYQL